MLPLAYVPFTIVGDVLVTARISIHPISGYSSADYHPGRRMSMCLFWVIFIWVLEKLRLVM